MSKKYDVAVVIGRFQPLHKSHVELIHRAAALATTVVIVVGSANQPRMLKNPWTSREREQMILGSVDKEAAQYKVVHNTDTIYDDNAWCERVRDLVPKVDKIALVGHHKDSSSFYLDMFPDWEYIEVDNIPPMDATTIRLAYFGLGSTSSQLVPTATRSKLIFDLYTPMYFEIMEELKFLNEHKQQYAGLTYPPIFVTADAMVTYHDYVLMVKRKHAPGKGLWALPGGYVNAYTDKSVQAAAIRELQEETNIDVSEATLVKCIKSQRTFDAVGRSARGRIITTCFRIDITTEELPKVEASDDAVEAKWIPLNELDSSTCFEDHYEIIKLC